MEAHDVPLKGTEEPISIAGDVCECVESEMKVHLQS